MTEQERLEKYVSIVPNRRQLIVQDMKFYAFIHYTVNTFTGKEWGTGKESPRIFNPKCQDVEQWIKAIKSCGMKGVILTCKHHDGFCLWPTKTTEHNISNSPYKDGKGDIVKEVSECCKKYGLKFGVYLSPWDRNAECYGTPEYNDFYIAQLTELLTNYGDIFMLWLDGACAASKDGKPRQKYDFERIWRTAVELQPDICMSGCAPDIRWVGNERGKCRESEWNVVPKFEYEYQNLAVNCQDIDDVKKFQKRCEDVMVQDLGSRQVLEKYDEYMWYPAEVDVSIRTFWFYHKLDTLAVKSLNHLMSIYYNSVGGNGLLLLNIPPNKNGLFHKKDVARLAEMGKWLEKESTLKLDNINVSNVAINANKYVFEITFDKCSIDRVRLEEDTIKSQRVEEFSIYAVIDDKKVQVYKGTIIGFGKIAIFDKPITTDKLILSIDKCRLEPYMRYIEVYKTGAFRCK